MTLLQEIAPAPCKTRQTSGACPSLPWLLQMNPISTLYHIAPCCFVFLALPFTYIELPKMVNDPNLNLNIPLLLASAACAFGEQSASHGFAGHGHA